jgi:regulator of protease activity HflC (stomatin/prohibitin superfamily)
MLMLKYLLMMSGLGMIVAAVSILTYDLYRRVGYRRAVAAAGAEPLPPVPQLRWRTSLALAMLAWGPLLLAFSIVVVASGMAGVRVSQMSGTQPGTLYPGVHLVVPLVEDVASFDTRDQIFTTGISEDGKAAAMNASKAQLLDVQAKEGLTLGLAITVRYRLDPKRLDYIQSNLPHPVEKEIVPPIVASVWRELVPNYTVRDVFSAKREEVRRRAAAMITQKLAVDGIVVKEVMLRDIQLPPEYAKGLETLLLKEQENDRSRD